MEGRRAALVSVINQKEDNGLEELGLLAQTAGYLPVAEMVQKRDKPDRAYYIGTGKIAELKELCQKMEVDIVIFNNDISGIQFKNLEDSLGIDVIDRSTLILEIFALHATSNEGKLQVELARKKYSLPRVLGQGLVLSRQGGGGAGGGGARRGGGEQQLELDRRTIREEIRELEQKIEKLTAERRLRRERRRKNRIKVVSIVGYTNAGKSTLMNYLTKAGVLEEDKLFATLDPVSRKMWLAPQKEFIIVDTVGFISRLPHEFIKAFQSTLEETKYADLIIHVVDSSSKNMLKEYNVVMDVLKTIGAENVPVITVMNKSDKQTVDIEALPCKDQYVIISAKTGKGIEQLKQRISLMLFGEEISW
ncbi:MAG: GTPase HflX [Christensenellales bacterium]|mgnify:CR=1 FL=1|jgi:GTP-binding protein HflX|nr:GTPase HflX [Clostridiales bacterium]